MFDKLVIGLMVNDVSLFSNSNNVFNSKLPSSFFANFPVIEIVFPTLDLANNDESFKSIAPLKSCIEYDLFA